MTRSEVVQVAAVWLALAVVVALAVGVALVAWSFVYSVALVGGFFAALTVGGVT